MQIPPSLRPDKDKWIWIGLLGIPVVLVVTAIVATLVHLSSSLPSLDQLEKIEPRLVTRIFDRDNQLAHEFYVERRIWTPIDSIPLLQQQAILAIEDRVFEGHWGMNPWAIPSAVVEGVVRGGKMRGASTLTQQLAKNLFLTPERKITRKIKEAMTAIQIEQTYTKQEILEFYLNTVCLGAGTYGFQAASDFYFGKPLDSVGLPEWALLAGMLQRPEGYRPDRKPEEALARRNTVLYAMEDAGYISSAQRDSAVATPLRTPESRQDGTVGGYYIEEIRKYMERKYGESSLYADGIRVYSTLDQDFQREAEAAVALMLDTVRTQLRARHSWMLGLPRRYKLSSSQVLTKWDSVYTLFQKEVLSKDTARIDSLRKFPDSVRYHAPEAALILIENQTGAIRAMVGGHDFSETKFNRAVQSLRQPGSSFKPFVYATAMDNGASPCDTALDQPITIPDELDPTKTWRPANYDNEFTGPCSYRRALYQSKNLPAIQVGMKYGLNNVVSYARKFGLKAPLSAVPSLAIGSIGATLMEMTSAYTVFPNGGTRIEPFYIDSIVNKSGEVIEKNLRVEHEVLRKNSAYIMVDMLRDVNIRGTAARIWASGFNHPSGGKTGTTNDYTDAWYIGFTKQYTMGVWVGTDAHVPMGPGHTGGDDALPIWLRTMKKVHQNLPKAAFPVPEGVGSLSICEISGKIAGPYCTAKSYCLYGNGTKPSETCDGKHTKAPGPSEGAHMFNDQSKSEDNKGRARKTF